MYERCRIRVYLYYCCVTIRASGFLLLDLRVRACMRARD